MKLKHLAISIQSGYQFRRGVQASESGNVTVIQINDLREDPELKSRPLARVKLDKVADAYRVEPGDVLFLSRGHRLFATALASPPPDAIVPNYFYVVRPRVDRVLPEYLAWYLNQPKAQARLAPVHAGTHMPLVAKSDFAEVEVDVPPLPVQKQIVAVADLMRREQQLMLELQDARQQFIERICIQAATRPVKKGNDRDQR